MRTATTRRLSIRDAVRTVVTLAVVALFLFPLIGPQASAQHEVAGTVTEQGAGALPGVNVQVQGETIGTVTNSEGRYSLEVPSPQDTLVFSFVGFQTEVVPVEGRSTINVELQVSTLQAEELVVVGYGTQERENVSGAVSVADAQSIDEVNPANAAEALQGVLPGVAVMDQGGAPGAQSIEWQIRGNTTIGSTQPLILINGIEGDLSDVNPNNIASVSVLKDASATAIYGSRAANGVVLIETKEAQAGQWTVQYNSYVGVDEVSEQPEMLNTMESIEIINQAYRNNGSQPRYSEEEIQAYREGPDTPEEKYQNPPLFPFFDAMFSRGVVHSHNLSASGGTERLSARMNLHYKNQEGIIPNFNEEVKGLSVNSDLQVSDRINLSGRVRFRRSTRREPQGAGGIYWNMWHGGIGAVPKYPDGTYGLTSNGANPLMTAEQSGTYRIIHNKFALHLEGEAQLLEDLTYTMEFGGRADLEAQDEFSRSFDVRDWKTGNVIESFGPNGLWEYRDINQNWTWRNLLNYDTSFGVHDVMVLGGFEQQWTSANWMDAWRQSFYNNQLRVLDAGSQDNLDNSGSQQKTRLRSGFGRIRYAYDNRYILELNGRIDGSSLFTGAENQYGYFPSFSVGWRIDQESFWEPYRETVSSLKLRGSWGETGNNTVDPYTFFQGINLGTNYSLNNQIVRTAAPGALVNRNLTWETTTQWNVGVDAEFWQGLLSVTADYWQKRTEGILLDLPIPDLVGLSGPPQNAGIVDNNGWEISVTHVNQIGDDFNYQIQTNLSNFHNEVVDLARTGPFVGWPTVTRVGSSLNAVYGYKTDGFFQSEEEVENYPTYAGKGDTYPGDVKYVDVNGDGNITPDDRTVLGNLDPHYTFGVSTRLQYKAFDASIRIQGVGKQNRVISGAPLECGNWLNPVVAACSDYWTEDNKDASIPRPQMWSTKNHQLSEQWLIDASYVRVKNLQVGYTLPAALTGSISASELRIYAQGTDLFTLSEATKWGVDPELNSGRQNFYPQTARYTVGLNLTF